MRWLVEISVLGQQGEAQPEICVEAAAWSSALQAARALQGQSFTLDNLAIEPVGDGFRVLDPTSRLRYVIRPADPGAPLTPSMVPEARATTPTLPPPAGVPAKVSGTSATVPALRTPVSKPPPAHPMDGAVGKSTLVIGSQVGASGESRPLGRVPASVAPPAMGRARVSERPPIPRTDEEDSLPPFTILTRRSAEPSDTSPLTYCEQVYAVSVETSEVECEKLIQFRLRYLRDELKNARKGKLINLAVFDHTFEGRPQRRPIVTLTWKDWKGDAEIRFPFREGVSAPPPSQALTASFPYLPPHRNSSPPAPAAVAPVSVQPLPLKPLQLTAAAGSLQSLASGLTSSADAPAQARVPFVTTETPELLAASEKELAQRKETPRPRGRKTQMYGSVPPEALAATSPSAGPVALGNESVQPAASTPPAQAASTPPNVSGSGRPKGSVRVSGDDLLAELFEASSDLHFLRDALEGADFVLALALEKLPSEVGMVSLHDINKREFVVVRQSGGGSSAVLSRVSERSPVVQTAMRTRRAVVVSEAEMIAKAGADDRWAKIGITPRTIMCAPVEVSGRYLGLIELANPVDDGAYSPGDGNALTYIGQQFAEFVASKGVVLDPDVVLPQKAPRTSTALERS